jgi:nitrogen fixation NifU-like protein
MADSFIDRQTAIELLLDRFEQPGRRGSLPSPPALSASATNPRCGDVVTMFADVEAERVQRVRFEGSGCTVSQVAADVVAELAEGQSIAAAGALDLEAILGVLGRDVVRTRLDCARLALRCLQQALGPA